MPVLGAVNAHYMFESDRWTDLRVDLSGTWVAMVQVQGTIDGVAWRPLAVSPETGGPSTTEIRTAGLWRADISAMFRTRIIVSEWTSGEVTFSTRPGMGQYTPTPAPVSQQWFASSGVSGATLATPPAGMRAYVSTLAVALNAVVAALAAVNVGGITVNVLNLPGVPSPPMTFSPPVRGGVGAPVVGPTFTGLGAVSASGFYAP